MSLPEQKTSILVQLELGKLAGAAVVAAAVYVLTELTADILSPYFFAM